MSSWRKKKTTADKLNKLNQTNKQNKNKKRKQLNYDKTKTRQKLNKQRSSGTIIRTAKTTTTKKPQSQDVFYFQLDNTDTLPQLHSKVHIKGHLLPSWRFTSTQTVRFIKDGVSGENNIIIASLKIKSIYIKINLSFFQGGRGGGCGSGRGRGVCGGGRCWFFRWG